jgi:hypothetical protein
LKKVLQVRKAQPLVLKKLLLLKKTVKKMLLVPQMLLKVLKKAVQLAMLLVLRTVLVPRTQLADRVLKKQMPPVSRKERGLSKVKWQVVMKRRVE